MPEFENDEQVAQALLNAAVEDGTASSTTQREAEVRQEQASPPAPDGDDQGATQETEDSFTSIDPNSLSPENQAIYKQMQADYTRKLQTEVAPYREFGDPEYVRQAVDFVTALTTDQDYALEVHKALTESLVSAGLTPAQASQEAGRQMQDEVNRVQGATQSTDFDDLSVVDPGLAARLEEQQRTIEELRGWVEEREEREFQSYLASEINRQEAEIIRRHPDYKDEDLDALYDIAHATGGNLFQADERLQALKQRWAGEYLDTKAQANEGTHAPIQGTQGGEQPPEGYRDLHDPRLERDVLDYVLREEAAGR